jgi:hypothetical protein
MNRVKYLETKLDLLHKDTVNKKALLILKHLLQLQDWKQSGYFNPMQLIMALYYMKRMLSVHFSMVLSLKYLDHVYKLKKSLYGLKQAPRAWYDTLSNFLIETDFKRGQVDTTLFRRTLENDILVVQIYVDDIIFGSTNASLCKEFSKLMQDEFEMSMMGELKFFPVI